jgi:hypothetical protein
MTCPAASEPAPRVAVHSRLFSPSFDPITFSSAFSSKHVRCPDESLDGHANVDFIIVLVLAPA